MQDGVRAHVVRATNVVYPHLPQDVLNHCHRSGLHSWYTGAPHSRTGLHPPTVGIKGHIVLVAVSIDRMHGQAIPCRRPRPPQTTPEASGEPSISLDVQDCVERDDLARFIHDEPEIGELVPGSVVVQQHRHV